MNKHKKISSRSVWNIIFSTYAVFLKKMTKKWLIMLLLSLLPALIIPIKVILEQYLYDYANEIYQGGTFEHSYWIFGIIILIQVLYIGTYSLYRSNINYIGSDLEIILQNQINKKTADMDLLSFEKADLYKKIELACNVSRDLRFMIMMFASELFVYFISFISVSGVLGSYHFALIIMGILAVFPDVLAKIVQSNLQYRFMDSLQEKTRIKNYYQDLLQHIDLNKEIRVYRTKDFFLKKWSGRIHEYNDMRDQLNRHNLKLNLICNMISFLSVSFSLVLVIYLVWRQEIGIGQFAASLSAVAILKSNFMRILNLGIFSFQCGAKGRYYYEVMDYEERKGIQEDVSPSEGITLRDVSFGYASDQTVFQHLNLSLKPAQTIAIVGKNGSGKSTLSKLILGLYLPKKGDICYGTKSILGVSEPSVYKDSSAVFQNYGKYYFTIEENIKISDSDSVVEKEKMDKLLKDLDFRTNVENTTIQTQLGVEFGGLELSGGNWQKLAIARALYRNHEMIVFDEPTSALDPLIEEKIYQKILNYKKDIIKIYVTHRMSTTVSADMILVVDHGKIVEMGTHQELMRKGGIYAQLWSTQAKWYKTV